MPVRALRLIRKMRGGAQAHMLKAEDGNFYIVKFRNNPQHRRILINELLASTLLRYLEIAQPETAVVEVTGDFLDEHPEAGMQLGSKLIRPEVGWHFGSRFPGDPDRQAVYDFLPDVLLKKVANVNHFLGILAFDKWTSNADARQSIFFRAKVAEWTATDTTGGAASRMGFVAQMVDHGFIFDGPNWLLGDAPLQGMYFRPDVYTQVRTTDDFQPWLDRIVNFPEAVMDEAWRSIPQQWFDGDEDDFSALLEKLMRRRQRLPDLIRACIKARSNYFPHWR